MVLPGPDLALQHPVHRPAAGDLSREHVEYVALPRRQLKWQSAQQRSGQAVVAARRWRTGLTDLAVPPRHQRPLQPHRLVEGQTLGGPVALPRVLGQVDGTQRLVFGYQIPLPQNRFRQRVHDVVKHVEHLAHTRVDVPALHLRGGWIDREELALEQPQAVRPHRLAPDSVAIAFSDLVPDCLPVRELQDQKGRMGQRHRALEGSHLTRQHDAGAYDELLEVSWR